jgi:hypothetical protein
MGDIGKNAVLGMGYGVVTQSPIDLNTPRRQSHQRFRSFAERYMIERASTFRADHIDEDTWRCVMDAKRAYKQIEAVGCTITDDN